MNPGRTSDSSIPATSLPQTPAAELQRRWQTGQEPEVEAFVAEWPVGLPQDLAEVVRVDLRQRWRRGEEPSAKEYLSRFPQLRSADLAVDVIYAEFLIREELGHKPALADYQLQYPAYAAELGDQVELHQALEASDDIGAGDTQPTELATDQTLGRGERRPGRLPAIGPDYELLSEIGRGGMGIVYRARQVSLNRLVALKMVRAADGDNAELLARFRSEAEVVSKLHHPQIVEIYDYGEHDGLPYLALELVQGGTLAARLGGTPWPPRQAAELAARLARAVQFAHDRGVVHRDLKPANILLFGGSDDEFKIADFGLAKLVREQPSAQTQSGTLLGTPSYMAPEQAVGRSQQLSPSTDVYALGAILYELLSGRPPFRGQTPLDTLQQLLTSEPISIQLLVPRLPRDLATICTKCLNREPAQRYSSALELAGDLDRYLQDRPILARPANSLERGWRWCRRNPAVAWLVCSVAALLVTVAAVSTVLSVRLSAQLQKTGKAEAAERSAKEAAQLRLLEAYVSEATAKHGTRQIGQRFETLQTVQRANVVLDEVGRTPERVLRLRNAAIAALALPDLRKVRRINAWPAEGNSADFSAAADRYVVGTLAGDLFVYRLSDGQELLRLKHEGESSSVISDDGKYVAACSSSGVKVWRIDISPPQIAWEERGAGQLTFSPDNRCAAVGGADGRMHLLELESGQKIRQLGRGAARSAFAFHGASNRVAVCTADQVQVISLQTGEVLAELTPPLANIPFPDVLWHPSGDFLAVSGYADGVSLWRLSTRRRHKAYPHTGSAVQCRFIAGGELLLTHDVWDGHLHLWQTRTARELLSDPAFHHFVGDDSGASPHLLLAADTGGATLWEVEPAAECSALPYSLPRSLGIPSSAAISPDGRLLAIGRESGLELWDLLQREHVAAIGFGPNCFCQFAADGSLIAHHLSGIYRWPRQESAAKPAGREITSAPALSIRFGPPQRLCGATSDPKFAISSTTDRLVAQVQGQWRVISPGSSDHEVRLGPQTDARMVALDTAGGLTALGSWNSPGVCIYDTGSGLRIADIPTGPYADVLFSPNRSWLATSPSGVELWRTDNWHPGPKLHASGTTPNGLSLAFSPDSRVVAIGQPTGHTRLVDPDTGADWAVLVHPDRGQARHIAFSPDQSRLVIQTPGPDAAPWVWDLAAIRRELAQRGLDWPADVLAPRPSSSTKTAAARIAVTFDAGDLHRQHEAQIALAQAGSERSTAARDLLQKAVELDPESALARNNLAWLLAAGPAEFRDPVKAVQHARRAVDLGGASHTALNTLGVALYRAAQYDEAALVLERSLGVSPPHESAYDLVFLALCHAQRGELRSATDFYVRAEASAQQYADRLGPSTRDELSQFLDEARALGLPHNQVPSR